MKGGQSDEASFTSDLSVEKWYSCRFVLSFQHKQLIIDVARETSASISAFSIVLVQQETREDACNKNVLGSGDWYTQHPPS